MSGEPQTVPKVRIVHCVVDANSRRDQEKGQDWDYRREKGCVRRQAFRSPNLRAMTADRHWGFEPSLAIV